VLRTLESLEGSPGARTGGSWYPRGGAPYSELCWGGCGGRPLDGPGMGPFLPGGPRDMVGYAPPPPPPPIMEAVRPAPGPIAISSIRCEVREFAREFAVSVLVSTPGYRFDVKLINGFSFKGSNVA
jgi:hypothetical protein